MTGHEYDVEVGDYVDGTLAPGMVAAFEAHLATCARCQAMAADFRTLRSAMSELEVHEPPPHLWTRISAEAASARPARHGWLSWMPADLTWRSAVAASILVAALSGGTWLSWREVSSGGKPVSVAAAPVVVLSASEAEPHVTAAAAMQEEITTLQRIIHTDSAILPEETKAIFDAATDEIDNAIGEPRAALAQQPSDELARDSLFEALRSKLTLLREMIALINQMRQGNQDEAARIVSGMQP